MEEGYYADYEEIDLRKYILLIWRKKYFLMGLVVLMVLLTGIYSFYILTPMYQAEAAVRLSNMEGLYSNPATAMRLFKSNALVRPVMNRLGQGYTEADLQMYLHNNMTLGNPSETKIIDITVKNKDPLIAKELLAGIVKDYKEKADVQYNRIADSSQENLISIENNIDKLDKQIEATNQDIENISNSNLNPTEKSVLMSGLTNKLSSYIEQRNSLVMEKAAIEEKFLSYQSFEILNYPYVLENPVSPNIKLNIAIAASLGLMIAVFLVFFIEFLKEENPVESVTV